MSLCNNCITGVRHEGTPTGTLTKIGGTDCYVATPSGEYARDKVLLYFPDALGMQSPNAHLLADDFALNGYKTVVVDYFEGEPVPHERVFAPGGAQGFDLLAWLGRHPAPRALETIRAVIAALKADGVAKFASTGYCYGGRTGFDLGFTNELAVVTTAHPSMLKCPEDLENYAKTSRAPLLINSCEVDPMFPVEAQKKADEILGGGKFAPGYERTYWEGCHHGYAVRGDMSNPKVKAGKEGTFEATVKFLKKHF
ncbi:alpha/beta-hydrolase [Epithele typhae]|uniref:alpha/beta-hydrolase n=1 Tax=Epithele typhae TaxID=378194 RepID=UPI0020088670|nr:alpha/beta-hydrolase [Epithele typhae]KAH9932723.1 alpha/beta-hydrolase [Epithele typhae]